MAKNKPSDAATDAVQNVPTEEQNTAYVATDAVFARYPSLDIYYQTGDGVAFFTLDSAQTYSAENNLDVKTIKKIVRK
jgi:hypothetical protein